MSSSSTLRASARCCRRFHEHPNPARCKRQGEAKEKGFSTSSKSASTFSPAFADDRTCSVSGCVATLTLVIFQTTVIFFQRRLLSSNIYFSIGNDWKPTTRLRLHYPHFIPSLRRKYYVRQFELYLATFARATSSALGQCSPVALPPHLLSQHRPPTIRKPES